MARTRERAKGRRGSEAEPFARLPLAVMQSPALATATHPAFRLLAILVAGRTPQQNGRLAVTDSYAALFGMRSHDTVQRAREELLERRLIVCTRPGRRLNKNPALYGVTWFPIYSRNGEPLDTPEPVSHAYLSWQPITPTSGAMRETERARDRPGQRGEQSTGNDFSPPRPAGRVTPAGGVVSARHRPDSGGQTAKHHPAQRGNSEISEGGTASLLADAEASLSIERVAAPVLAFSTAKQKPSLAKPEAPATAHASRSTRSLHRDEPDPCDSEFPETAEDLR